MKKKSVIYLLVLTFALFLMVSCQGKKDWIMFRGEQGRGGTSNSIRPPLGEKWKLRLQVSDDPAVAFNNPVVLNDTIYFGSSDGNFYALDIQTGYMRWVYKTKGVINSVPYADEEKIYFGSNDGRVYAVNQENGEEVWSFQTDSTVASAVVGYKDLIIFSSDGGTTYFLSPEGVKVFSLPNPVWHRDTFQVYENVMYFAPGPINNPHSFAAFDVFEKSYLWIMPTAAMNAIWYSFPALDGNSLFMSTANIGQGSLFFSFYSFNRRNGDIIWKRTDISDLGDFLDMNVPDLFERNINVLDYMAPSLWNDLVIFAAGDTKIRAFTKDTGRPAWERQFNVVVSSSPTIAGNRLYFGLKENPILDVPAKLVCLSARNGRLLWETEIEGSLLSAPVIAGKWIIFGTDKNFFYVLEELY